MLECLARNLPDRTLAYVCEDGVEQFTGKRCSYSCSAVCGSISVPAASQRSGTHTSQDHGPRYDPHGRCRCYVDVQRVYHALEDLRNLDIKKLPNIIEDQQENSCVNSQGTRTLPATSRVKPKSTRLRVFQSFLGHTFSRSLHIMPQSFFRCSFCVGFSASSGPGGAGVFAGVGVFAASSGAELWYPLCNE